MQNQRKRPRQNVSSGPQADQVGPGPSGAAGYSGLMPIGGFSGNKQQQAYFPTSGRGAATVNRSTSNNNVRVNQPSGQYYNNAAQRGNANHQRGIPKGNGPSTHVQHQQGVRNNTSQNRNIPTGRGRGAPQSFRSMTPTNQPSTSYTSYQNGPNTGCNNTSLYGGGIGMDQNNWGYMQPCNMMGNSTRISSYGRNSFNHGNNSYTSNQGTGTGNMYQHIPQNQPQQYMPIQWSNQDIQPYNMYQQGNGGFYQNQAADISDEWNNSFTELTPAPAPTQTVNKVNTNVAKTNSGQKTALTELKKSLHLLTVDVTAMKRWNKFKDSVQIMFELFGQLDSATTKGRLECKEFLIRDEKKNNVTCIFYEIDRQLPKITRGQWYRLVGNYNESKSIFKCLSIRPMQPSERNMIALLSQKSTETMRKLTINMRES